MVSKETLRIVLWMAWTINLVRACCKYVSPSQMGSWSVWVKLQIVDRKLTHLLRTAFSRLQLVTSIHCILNFTVFYKLSEVREWWAGWRTHTRTLLDVGTWVWLH